MGYLHESPLYKEAIHEMNYPFGNFYLFDGFIIAEINEGVIYTWEHHAKIVVQDILELYDQDGENLVYITNRMYSYSVMPSDWLKFYKNNYKLKGYGVISYTPKGILNGVLEKLFVKSRFRSFNNLEESIAWAKNIVMNTTI